jgi:hypothetical protein
VNWLKTIADEDQISLDEAAVYFVRSGATMSATEWANLEPEGRVKVLLAQQVVRVRQMEGEGNDLAAAREYASLDGGRRAARLMAEAAMHGVANALRPRPETG